MVHRLRLRANRTRYRLVGAPRAVTDWRPKGGGNPGWPDGFTPVDGVAPPEPPTAADIRVRRFDLVGQERDLRPRDWAPIDVDQLYRYHLNYMEWAWPLVGEPDGSEVFGGLWREWLACTTIGLGDAWHPYVASLRAWVMCGLHRQLVAGEDWEPDYLASLRAHAGYLLGNLELDVGGNHLMKNVKALIGLGVFFGDDRLLTRGRALLERQLPAQVLPDGGHFERSPSYHAQVLADLIDMHGLLDAAGLPPLDGLADAAERMRAWLGHILMPDDTVPLLRDCLPVAAHRLRALAVAQPASRSRMHHLADTGYVVAHVGRMHAVLDVGQPCPPELPAHAQADSLNWVLHVDGQPFVIDTGTSSYQNLSIRSDERATAAHNTVEIDGHNSTEVFGSFRAGRLARVTLLRAEDDGEAVTVEAEHDGYRFLDGSPVHRRRWIITADEVRISDRIEGAGLHTAVAHVHHIPTPGIAIETKPTGLVRETIRAEGMYVHLRGKAHITTVSGRLPIGLSTTVRSEELGHGDH